MPFNNNFKVGDKVKLLTPYLDVDMDKPLVVVAEMNGEHWIRTGYVEKGNMREEEFELLSREDNSTDTTVYINRKFKCLDDHTVYTLESLGEDGYYTISWVNEIANEKRDRTKKQYVDQFFEKGDWYYLDAPRKDKQEEEHTGGSVNYYKVHVAHPTTLPEAYDAEANDIIESLGLTFAEGNLFKAIWRMAADRNGKKKKGNNSVYDAEKLCFFAERVLVQEKAKRDETN